MRRALAAFGATLTLAATASAHDYWPTASRFPTGSRPRAAGRPMRITCGPTKCTASPTTIYEVDGYHRRVPVSQALPSQDRDYWIFYRDDRSDGQSGMYCFFVPMDF
jgi:hypothetical protein